VVLEGGGGVPLNTRGPIPVLPTGPKFRPHNSKVAGKKTNSGWITLWLKLSRIIPDRKITKQAAFCYFFKQKNW
jgi:hypothetical protein